MTREQAIKWLEYSKDNYEGLDYGAPRIALDMAIAALREQDVPDTNVGNKWISVEESLPEPFVSVLGYCPDEEPLPTVHECYMSGFGQWTSAQVYGMGNVTHWMPLPEPPKEDT